MRLMILSVIVSAMAAPIWADEQACQTQAELTQLIVDERLANTAAPEAVTAVSKVLSEEQMIYKDALPALVEWIYALPEDQVNDDLAGEYELQCQEALKN